MGLDMYLYAKRYIWGEEREKKDELQKIISIFTSKGNEIVEDMSDYELKTLTFEVGYWRKVNHIHNWFVQNVQEGIDDCKEYDVNPEKLKELLELVNQILNEKGKDKRVELAQELLPVAQGFFFGGYEYDKFYFDGLEETKDILEKLFKIKDINKYDISYQSSW